MADFSALKTAIQTYIKQNGNEEITGEILQEILLSVVTTLGDSAINDLITALANEVAARQNADGALQQNITNEATARGNADTALGGRIDDEATTRANGDTALSNRLGSTITEENTAADQIGAEAEAREAADTVLQGLIDGITDNIENGYVYAGIATPSSTPASGKVFYLALTAGTYTNFGGTEVSQGINILKYNGSAWSLDAFIGIDDEPTPNSPKLVKSGGVFNKVMTDGSAFDISAHFASGGTLATYADLSAALTDLNTLSANYKRGGMSIKFVQSSDNKYVQFFLTKDEWSASEADWQKMNLEEEVKMLQQRDDWLIKPDYSFILVNGEYLVAGSGAISQSELYSRTTPKQVSKGDIVVMWKQGSGITALEMCTSDGTMVKGISFGTSDDVILVNYVVEDDGYIMMSSKTSVFATHKPFVVKGFIRTMSNNINQLLDNDAKQINLNNWLIAPDSSFTFVQGEYLVAGSGTISQSPSYSRTTPKQVSKGDIVVMWKQGGGITALETCTLDGVMKKVISEGTSDDIVLVNYIVEEDGYIMMSSTTQAFIDYPPFVVKGFIKSIVDMLSQTEIKCLRNSQDLGWLMNSDVSIEYVNGKYLTPGSGAPASSPTFSYTLPKQVSKGDLVVMWRMGIGTIAMAVCDNAGNYIRTIKLNTAGNCSDTIPVEYVYEVEDGVSYIEMGGKTQAFIDHPPLVIRGALKNYLNSNSFTNQKVESDLQKIYSTGYINELTKNWPYYDASAIRMSDDDKFLKIFFLDCGRKFYSVNNVKLMIDECSENNVGFIALHFSENEGFRFVVDDSTFTYNGTTYDIESVAGDNGTRGDGSNMWWTEADMDEIISYADSKNVGVIPDFDMPGHMGCLLRLITNSGSSTLNILDTTQFDIGMIIAEKYISYFASKGCKYYNFGCDEPSAPPKTNQSAYSHFMNSICHIIANYNMIPFAFNDCFCCVSNLPYMNKGINVIYWNAYLSGSRTADELLALGYRLISTGYDGVYYYIMSSTYTQEQIDSWLQTLAARTVNRNRRRGVMFCLWSETPAKYGADGGDAVTQIILPFIEAFGQVTPVD